MSSEFFGHLPPEIADHIKHQIDQGVMRQEEAAHNSYRILEEMNEEQLRFLRDLLIRVGDGEASMYFAGYITRLLVEKTGMCGACGANHDEELAEVVASSADDAPVEPDDPEDDAR